MAWSAADIPDQSGRVAVVTGANGGLGLEVSPELARKGAFVVMASRDKGKAEEARGSIRGEIPDASLELQALDLASLAAVREAAGRSGRGLLGYRLDASGLFPRREARELPGCSTPSHAEDGVIHPWYG